MEVCVCRSNDHRIHDVVLRSIPVREALSGSRSQITFTCQGFRFQSDADILSDPFW
jgi:hypothetical protein